MRIIIPQFKQSPAAFIQVVLLAGALLFLAGGFTVLAQDALTPPESRGKQIYVQGTSASGRAILAYLGASSIEVPGSAMACANCHGLDGRGKPEGGVNPSDLRWESLTKPYGLPNANGRKHSPYTERALELAITRGTLSVIGSLPASVSVESGAILSGFGKVGAVNNKGTVRPGASGTGALTAASYSGSGKWWVS